MQGTTGFKYGVNMRYLVLTFLVAANVGQLSGKVSTETRAEFATSKIHHLRVIVQTQTDKAPQQQRTTRYF